jgi:hypothetical protein
MKRPARMELCPAVTAVAWMRTPRMKTVVAIMMLYFLDSDSAMKPEIGQPIRHCEAECALTNHLGEYRARLQVQESKSTIPSSRSPYRGRCRTRPYLFHIRFPCRFTATSIDLRCLKFDMASTPEKTPWLYPYRSPPIHANIAMEKTLKFLTIARGPLRPMRASRRLRATS